MGQKIFYIITKNEYKPPIDIVHFKENNGLIFPLLFVDISEFENLLERSKDTRSVSDFFYYGVSLHCLDYPTKKVFEFINNNKISSFGIIGYQEILEIPENLGEPLLFVDKKRNFDVVNNNYKEEFIHKQLQVNFTFGELIRNEKKYWSFYSSESQYFKKLEEMIKRSSD